MTPVVETRMTEKHAKYGQLHRVAHLQKVTRQQQTLPNLWGATLSHDGELVPDTIGMCEWIVKHYKTSVWKEMANY